ncbi:MAG TPA: hypothetical protein VGA99_06100 [bacterium]
MPLQEITLKRLSFIKYLYKVAVEQSNNPEQYANFILFMPHFNKTLDGT